MILVTHDGCFHNDEVLATAILMMAFSRPEKVVRTRDISEYEKMPNAIIYDVGEKCDGKRFFDHHQEKFSEKFSDEFENVMAAAGLVWKAFGNNLCPSEEVWKMVYRNFIYSIDCQDNGINDVNNPPSFQINGWNPTWEETGKEGIEDGRFWEAVLVVGKFLKKEIERATSTIRAKTIVEGYIKNSREVGSKILLLKSFVPYGEFLSGKEEFIFVVYPSQKKDHWRIQSLADGSGVLFQSKKKLPKSWIENNPIGMTFCHQGRFLCEVTSFQRAIELAQEAILTP